MHTRSVRERHKGKTKQAAELQSAVRGGCNEKKAKGVMDPEGQTAVGKHEHKVVPSVVKGRLK